jgi:AcrR family transcriptional regulator
MEDVAMISKAAERADTRRASQAPAVSTGPSEKTRRALLEAAARVFADEGFYEATKEKIGASAGYSHQTVRDYFRTKELMLLTIASDVWRVALLALREAPQASPVDRLAAAYEALSAYAERHPAEARCALHETQIAGPHGGPLAVAEEQALRHEVARLAAEHAGLPPADAAARAEAAAALLTALTRPAFLDAGGRSYSRAEASESFRALAAAVFLPRGAR